MKITRVAGSSWICDVDGATVVSIGNACEAAMSTEVTTMRLRGWLVLKGSGVATRGTRVPRRRHTGGRWRGTP